MFAFDQTSLLEGRDMLGDRRFGTHAEVSRNLSVRWFVSVIRGEADDVIQDFFLTLSARQHASQSSRVGILNARIQTVKHFKA